MDMQKISHFDPNQLSNFFQMLNYVNFFYCDYGLYDHQNLCYLICHFQVKIPYLDLSLTTLLEIHNLIMKLVISVRLLKEADYIVFMSLRQFMNAKLGLITISFCSLDSIVPVRCLSCLLYHSTFDILEKPKQSV